MTNRFFNIEGDVSVQLAPWELKARGNPLNVALFKLKEPIRFRSDIAGGVIVVWNPTGDYISDLASIPQWAWSVFMAPDDPRIELGGWVHDYLYDKGMHSQKCPLEGGNEVSLTRKQADEILTREAMPDLLATSWQCTAVFQALRRFGKKWPGNSLLERLT